MEMCVKVRKDVLTNMLTDMLTDICIDMCRLAVADAPKGGGGWLWSSIVAMVV